MLRPQSALIRQSSWSGLSESSSHESLTGSLVKSSSLSSMKAGPDRKPRPLPGPPQPCHLWPRPLTLSFLSSVGRPCRKTIPGANGGDGVSRKPPMGRREASTPPPAPPPPAGALVRRSQVCLSTFYRDCGELADSEPDCSTPLRERDGRSGSKVTAGWGALVTALSPQSGESRGRELQQRGVARAGGPGGEAAAAAHAHQTHVRTPRRQRGRPAGAGGRRGGRGRRAKGVGAAPVQESGGHDSESQREAGQRHV